jgi:16S rRNA (adenine1518-N6/adenine1519-N6)-dimethyltransferase
MYSPLASPHAAREVLERHGLHTRKRFGQHLLIDDGIVGRILTLADLSGDEVVLEVGPGIGTLTVALCDRVGSVVAVEMDERLSEVLAQTGSVCDNLSVIMGDAVKISVDELRSARGPIDMLVANLPYSVAATVVLRCFEEIDSLSSAVVMVQAEVAERMAAAPGGKDYGAYTVKLALRARTGGSFHVPRGCFMPPPRVDSTVIRLDREPATDDLELLGAAGRVTDAAFSQRRKTMRNSLSAGLGVASGDVERTLIEAGIDPGSRAETHAPREFLTIASFAAKNGLLP